MSSFLSMAINEDQDHDANMETVEENPFNKGLPLTYCESLSEMSSDNAKHVATTELCPVPNSFETAEQHENTNDSAGDVLGHFINEFELMRTELQEIIHNDAEIRNSDQLRDVHSLDELLLLENRDHNDNVIDVSDGSRQHINETQVTNTTATNNANNQESILVLNMESDNMFHYYSEESNEFSYPTDDITVAEKTSNDVEVSNILNGSLQQQANAGTRSRNTATSKRKEKATTTGGVNKRGVGRPRKEIIESPPPPNADKKEKIRYKNMMAQRKCTRKRKDKRKDLLTERESLFKENCILNESVDKTKEEIRFYLSALQDMLTREDFEKVKSQISVEL